MNPKMSINYEAIDYLSMDFFILPLLDELLTLFCSPIMVLDDYISKQFSQSIHHCLFMRHKRMDISVKCNSGRFMSKNLG